MNYSSQLRTRLLRVAALLLAAAILALLPLFHRSVGGLLPGPVDSAGSLQMLALMLVAAATAVTLDVMFGYAGVLSFGHSLYFGLGCYATVILANIDGISFGVAAILAVLITAVVSVIANATALRSSAIGFSMISLALAQILATGVERGYLDSGGEVGVIYEPNVLPGTFVGIANTRNAYWLALGLLGFVLAVSWYATRSQAGHVWQAIRENDLRVQVLGYNVYLNKLAATVIGSTLAGVCGVVYSVVMGGADPSVVGLSYSLAIVLMVVIGGRGVLWGAALGGVLYEYLELRLAAVSNSGTFQDLPGALRVPLTQPNFLLGVTFILVILFMPGGLAAALSQIRLPSRTRCAHQEKEVPTADVPTSHGQPAVHPRAIGANSADPRRSEAAERVQG